MRGVAAFAVVLGHARSMIGLPVNGMLAVDFFFVLSGFVIAYAYEDRLARGLGLGEFALRRTIRLYPSMVFSVLMASVLFAGNFVMSRQIQMLPVLAGETALNLALIPQFASALRENDVFPLNNPMWSLFFEILANIAFAVILYRLSDRIIMFLIALSAVVYLAMIYTHNLAGAGFKPDAFYWGFPRIALPFLAGIMIHRLMKGGKLQRLPVPAWSIVSLLVVCLIVPNDYYFLPLVTVFVAWPLLVYLGASYDEDKLRFSGFWSLSGRLSYPLYLIHFPIWGVFLKLKGKVPLPPIALGITFVGISLVMAYAVLRLFDEPVREWLNGWLKRRRSSPSTT